MAVTIEEVIKHNKIDVSLDAEYIQEHLTAAQNEIDYELGSDTTFNISTTAYPHFYYEAIKKLTYVMMLPEMHLHYKVEYPDMNSEMDTFYLTPAQATKKVADLQERINLLIGRLKKEISEQTETLVTGKAMFSVAGGNRNRIKKYKNTDYFDRMVKITGVNNDDKE